MPPSRHIDGLTPRTRPAPPPLPPPPAPRKRRRTPARFLQRTLLYASILFLLYLSAGPFVFELLPTPKIATTPTPTPVAVRSVADMTPNQPSPSTAPIVHQPDHLTIPAIGVDADIVEGQDASALDKGVWHRPNSSTPDRGSNTVLAAHRFLYTSGSRTFYYLDRVKVGDQFSIRWDDVVYTYAVASTQVVGSQQVDIENPTSQPQVTLYTCTPLWTSEKRLVVIGKPIAN